MKRYTNTGFTLLELTITMLIIGLIAGGILGGRSLLHASELRSIIKDGEMYMNGVKYFEEKFKYKPGDFPTATSVWGKSVTNCNADPQPAGTPGTCNGDGDGKIADSGEDTEYFLAWQHLSLGGFIPGEYTGVAGPGGPREHLNGINAPASRLAGGGYAFMYIGNVDASNADWFVGSYGQTMTFGANQLNVGNHFNYGPIITPSEAYELDGKIDNGKPGTGGVRVFKNSSPKVPNCSTTDDAILSEYNLVVPFNDQRLCSLMFIYDR